VEQKLRSRNLLKQAGGNTWGVSVDVAPTGAVTLTGIVQNRDQRTETIRLAGEVPGVSEVRPNINVRESWTR
jgi:osmotically-inducible protein OsmY